MNPQSLHLLRKSLAVVEAKQPVPGLVFYRRLLEIEPSLQSLFRRDIEAQAQRFVEMLSQLATKLDRPEELHAMLVALGQRHSAYGAKPEYFPLAGRALLDMVGSVLDRGLSPAARKAWSEFFEIICTGMLEGMRLPSVCPSGRDSVGTSRHRKNAG